ncbi:MAG: C39 family peptidase [Clostridia bacterium]|nr:C39 family peptidase [Clostridia bacterium]
MKRKRKIRGGAILILIAMAVTAAVAFILLRGGSAGTASGPEDRVWKTEALEAERRGNLLKVDAETPGLDTYSDEITLFDLAEKKETGRLSLPEGAWVTGLTDGGFYTVETAEKTVRLYDPAGKETFRKTFAGEGTWSNAAAVSAEGAALVYIPAPGTALRVADLKTGAEKTLEPPFPVRKILGFEKGGITVLGIDAQTALISAETGESRAVSQDPRCYHAGKSFSLGMTDNNFIYEKADRTAYLPFSSVDEWIAGMGDGIFVTSVMQGTGTLLRFYDVEREELFVEKTDQAVQTVLPGPDEAVAVTGGPGEYRIRLIRCDKSAAEKLEVTDRDAYHAAPAVEDRPAAPKAEARMVKNVPLIPQHPQFPTGCESVSAVMALQFAGENVDADTFVQEYLPQSARYYVEGGKKYGPSPYETFIGTPTSAHSYGCMAPVIEKALHRYYGDATAARNTTGADLPALCRTYIDRDVPVIVWATIKMLDVKPTNSWYLADGTLFTWPGNEHCMLLVGYDAERYYFNDPYTGQLVGYDKALTEDRFEKLGRQSVVIERTGL